MAHVLVVDDNALDRKIARDALLHAGFEVHEASDGPSAVSLLDVVVPDIVILDVVMPSMDGWAVCRCVRERSSVPIIMLTCLDREDETVRGLDLGADDFVSKPVSPAHLVARVRAVLRRAAEPNRPGPRLLYEDDGISIDVAAHQVKRDGSLVSLTPTEFRLLVTLVEAPNQVQTYSALLSTVWGPEYVDDIDFLRVYIWRLRKKLEADPTGPRWLLTERGFGYRFSATAPLGSR